jgi:hypothetical protein
VVQAIEHLLCKPKALSLNPSPTQKKKRKKERKRERAGARPLALPPDEVTATGPSSK